MKLNLFKDEALTETSPKWFNSIKRLKEIYLKQSDIRSNFFRDYTRILHSNAYSRLKNKTQVFFATNNDHICTRIEHVNHVAAISYNIANYLGLNHELTSAIAIGHDLGHPPFGHVGETIIKTITRNANLDDFWHEKNSLRFVDKCVTLSDQSGNEHNLNLTYAVRDGIICHCGEVDESYLKPRNEYIDLQQISKPSQYAPYTWEGCIVKISDKIAYLGRDIEDAFSYKILTISQQKQLIKIARRYLVDKDIHDLTNSSIIHNLVIDLVNNSDPEKGILFSFETLQLLKEIKDFNYNNIYNHPKLIKYHKYAELIITSIYETLDSFYNKESTVEDIEKKHSFYYPQLSKNFTEWLLKYSDIKTCENRKKIYYNDILYSMALKDDYNKAMVDFISGMTDRFAIKVFNEIMSF